MLSVLTFFLCILTVSAENEEAVVRMSSDIHLTESTQQKKIVTGTLVDEQGEPIIGANIMEKETTNGVVTDFDGNFSLSVDNNATLVVSYIGYITQDVNVSGKNNVNIVLEEDSHSLEEVVVIAYGEQSAHHLLDRPQ